MRRSRLAWLGLLLGAACGGDSGGSGLDAAPTMGALTITVVQAGAPVGGAKVVAHDVDGSVMTETTTNTNGVATPTVHAGGYVTALWQDALGNYLLYTYAGVKRGDTMHAKLAEPPATSATTLTIRIQDAVTNATEYRGTDNCGMPGNGMPIT